MKGPRAVISPENKELARYVSTVFGGTPRVHEYADESETVTIGILFSRDRPQTGITSYSTIRLSDHPMRWLGGEFPTRIELAGVCAEPGEFFPNILASAAFRLMESDAVYHPGTVLRDSVSKYYPSLDLPHLYLTAPFFWGDKLQMVDCGTKKVSWLLAMPISESECSYLMEKGDAGLERLFEASEIDFSDLGRASAI